MVLYGGAGMAGMSGNTLLGELKQDLELAWDLFSRSQDAGEEGLAIEYMRLAMDAEERLARLMQLQRDQGQAAA